MDKRKKIIIGSVVGAVLLIALVIGVIFYHNYHEKKLAEAAHQKLIDNTKKKFQFFTSNELKNNTSDSDELTLFFNNIILESKKNEEINLDKFVKNNINATKLFEEKTKELIDNEIGNYSTNSLTTLNEDELKKLIHEDVDKDTVINIYNSNNFIKQMKQEIEKRENYTKQLEKLNTYIEYFSKNKDQATVDNETITYKSDEIKQKLEELNKEYNLNFKMQKEVIKQTANNSGNSSTGGVPILCYHGVLDQPWGQSSLFVKVAEFEAQMKYLSENGYTTLFASEIASANKYKKPIIITFDDGYKDVYTNAFPILKKYNLKANVYMISGWINGDVYMTTAMTKEMSDSPNIEIGSHTVNHKALATLSDSEIDSELKNSQITLEQMIGKKVDVIAYPTGSYDSRVLNAAAKYYKYGLSTNKGKENPSNLNTYKLNRIYVYRSYNINQFKNAF